jgi:hypothetical protein
MAEPEGDRVDFEVLAVMNGNLLVRYRMAAQQQDVVVNWNGEGDVIDTLTSHASLIAHTFRQPPPPSTELLQAQVGKQGSTVVPVPPS